MRRFIPYGYGTVFDPKMYVNPYYGCTGGGYYGLGFNG